MKLLTPSFTRTACRYSKGLWTECKTGMRSRVDHLKGPAPGCDPERTITRKCKVICRYNKADWGPCEGGVKTKTLALVEGNTSECESSKKITKQCVGHQQSGNHSSGIGGGPNTTRTPRGKSRKLTTPIP